MKETILEIFNKLNKRLESENNLRREDGSLLIQKSNIIVLGHDL